MIELKDVTLKYSSTKGIFNLNFNVEKGEAFGYVGPNDAGKTTTIRMLMGLIRAGRGSATIDGLNCFSRAASIQKNLGYVPEDVVLFENMRVKEYLNFITQMRGIFGQKDSKLRDSLIERFEVETRGKIENMSNGMKKRLAIVTALMHDPQTLVLDEKKAIWSKTWILLAFGPKKPRPIWSNLRHHRIWNKLKNMDSDTCSFHKATTKYFHRVIGLMC